MSMVYLQSDAKELLQSNFLHQYSDTSASEDNSFRNQIR